MHWVNIYVGIPYADISEPPENGLDCWQLARVVMREQFDIRMPSLRYAKSEQNNDLSKCFLSDYDSFYEQFVKVPEPQEGDLILFLKDKVPVHVGVAINSIKFLHTLPNPGAVVESLDSYWMQRLDGFYRHKSRTQKSTTDSAGGSAP